MEHFVPITPGLQLRLLEIEGKAEPVHGWLAKEAGVNLYRLARFRAPTGTIVELGSWKGRSTIWLAHAALDRGNGTVYAVDTWEGSGNYGVSLQYLHGYGPDQLYGEFLDNLTDAGVRDRVMPMRGTTAEARARWAVREPIGLLYIDADHVYESVKADFEMWSPLVAPGGYVVFDDVPAWPGPSRFVYEIPRDEYEFVHLEWNHYIARKTDKARQETVASAMARLMKLDDSAFVAELYRELLGREPDGAGHAMHLALLRSWGSRRALAAALLRSREAGLP